MTPTLRVNTLTLINFIDGIYKLEEKRWDLICNLSIIQRCDIRVLLREEIYVGVR